MAIATSATPVKLDTTRIETAGRMIALSQDRLNKAILALEMKDMVAHGKALRDMEIINRALTQQNLKVWMSIIEMETRLNTDRGGLIDEQLRDMLDAVESDAPNQCRSGLIKPTDLTAPGASLVVTSAADVLLKQK